MSEKYHITTDVKFLRKEFMLASKRNEAKLETYRYEMVYSVLGTLQWGLGGTLVDWIH